MEKPEWADEHKLKACGQYSGFYLELLFWRRSESVEDNFITIYADAFNQPLPLAETFGGKAQSFGGEASPLPPPVDRTLVLPRIR